MLFVNGRFVKSQLLTAALEEAYKNQMMKGKFPGCVLSVTLPVTAVDVNVHPAKTKVKFAREKEVFDAVYHTVMDCLDAKGSPIAAAKPAQQVVNPRNDFFQTMDAKTYREQGVKSAEKPAAKPVQTAPVRPAAPARSAWSSEWNSTAKVAESGGSKPEYRPLRPIEKPAGAFGKPPASVTAKPVEQTMAPAPVQPMPKPVQPCLPAAAVSPCFLSTSRTIKNSLRKLRDEVDDVNFSINNQDESNDFCLELSS